MKKSQVYRRIKTMFAALRDLFVEEDSREKARRTMREAAESLNRVIYQRIALEHECHSGSLDHESRMWCEENLMRLNEAERAMSERLSGLREQYRTLMLQDLFYKTVNDPTADCFEQAQTAILELQASVEGERVLRSIPRLVDGGNSPRAPRPIGDAQGGGETETYTDLDEIIVDHEPPNQEHTE
jgi:hypothetical protein